MPLIVKTLKENPWVSLKEIQWPEKGYHGYVFSEETRCNGQIVSILPYKYIEEGRSDVEFLLRQEITPCWHPDEHRISSITGGVEKCGARETALHELKEEAGYIAEAKDLISLGTCQGTKSSNTVYSLFGIDLTTLPIVKATGDGSELERIATCVWGSKIDMAVDPLVYVLHYRLNKYLKAKNEKV